MAKRQIKVTISATKFWFPETQNEISLRAVHKLCSHFFSLLPTKPSRTTVACSDDQLSKHVNGCILVIKIFNKHSIGKMYLVKVISLSWFHVKSLIKSLIFKIFFSAWSGRLAQKQAQSVPVRHSIRETDMGLCIKVKV